MVTESERQAIIDEEHLRLLPIFYWVLGAVDVFVGMYGLIYVGMGVVFSSPQFLANTPGAVPPPAFFGQFMTGIGVVFMLVFGISAALKIMTGFWIRKRKYRTACLVVAGITCLSIPFGTIAGVFTFLALLRPSVAALFTRAPGMSPTPVPGAGPDEGEQTPTAD